MIKFILKRLVFGLFVLMGAIIIVFFIFQVLPGDPSGQLLPQSGTPEDKALLKKQLGLDKGPGTQLLYYMRDLSPVSVLEKTKHNQQEYNYTVISDIGDNKAIVLKYPYLRRSFNSNQKVGEMISDKILNTFILAVLAILVATVFGILMGTFASLSQNSFTDHFMVITSVIGISVPSFVAGAILVLVFAVILHEYTGLNPTGGLWVTEALHGEKIVLKNLILPTITLALRPLAIIVQLTRSSMLEVLSQDFIRTARAKGLPFRTVIIKHALKNALNPVITAVTGWLATLMAGAFFVEMIFDWKGLGWLTIKAIGQRDFPVVMGSVIVIAAIFIVVSILVDILYAIIDPRVKLR